ncbi:aquaporin-10-like protein 2, partial [Dinothrombium tinctorium]
MKIVGDGAIAAFLLKDKKANPFVACFCFGIGALIGISASLNISGGHINPAVTVAFAALKKFPLRKVWYYLLSQYLGGFVAAAAVFAMYYDGINEYDGGVRSAFNSSTSTGEIFATYPAPHLSILGGFVDQVIGTAILLFAVLAVTDENNIKTPKGLIPLVLAFVITGVCVAFHLNAGAILNPARDLAPRLFTAVAGYGWEPFRSPQNGHYWYVTGVLGPHIGALIGTAVYLLTIDHQNLLLLNDESGNVEVEEIRPTTNGKFLNKCIRS